jgi:hypothetical protein
VFLKRGPWGYVHAEWPEVGEAHARIDSLQDLPEVVSDWRKRRGRLRPSAFSDCRRPVMTAAAHPARCETSSIPLKMPA